MAGLVKRTTNLAVVRAQAYAEANMTAKVRVSRPIAAVFSRQTGQLVEAPDAVVYEGPARVYGVQGPATYAIGEEPTYFSSSYVSIPLRSELPRVDDVVQVLEHDDPLLVGRHFRVQDVESGGQLPVVRRLSVTGIQASRQAP